jgi:hypothetical protein
MKITIESTSRLCSIELGAMAIEARVWEGKTESGIPVVCLIPRIASPSSEHPTQFDAELRQCKPPTAASDAFPLRMIL